MTFDHKFNLFDTIRNAILEHHPDALVERRRMLITVKLDGKKLSYGLKLLSAREAEEEDGVQMVTNLLELGAKAANEQKKKG